MFEEKGPLGPERIAQLAEKVGISPDHAQQGQMPQGTI
jgi:hypothetical protein